MAYAGFVVRREAKAKDKIEDSISLGFVFTCRKLDEIIEIII